MSEGKIRQTLKAIDDLRSDATACLKMATHWMGHDGELVTESSVVVKRRWRGSLTVHSTVVMDAEERDLFRDYLYLRAARKIQEADDRASAFTPHTDDR